MPCFDRTAEAERAGSDEASGRGVPAQTGTRKGGHQTTAETVQSARGEGSAGRD